MSQALVGAFLTLGIGAAVSGFGYRAVLGGFEVGSPTRASQVASGTPDAIPTVEECNVPPRPLEDFVVPAESPVAASHDRALLDESDLPGEPADAEIIAEIEAVARQYTACLNARDLRRVASLTTDASFREWLLSEGRDEAERVIARILATPEPLPPDQRRSVAVRGVRLLPDGRVGAIVEWCPEANFILFAKEGGRWLYDGEVAVRVAQGCRPRARATPRAVIGQGREEAPGREFPAVTKEVER